MTDRNRLGEETSPYLLQHADNPVHWQPWDDEALEAARAGNKPILLSIGYSACHWCHVMEHESFEDEATAALMNEHFVNIKVDREERPDIDKIYQIAHQLITQRAGGWPLTMFLEPESRLPFFGGTYFPREERFGMPSFKRLLDSVAAWYREHPAEARRQGEALGDVFPKLEPEPPPEGLALDAEPISAIRTRLERDFDTEYGGFGGAPKFPHPTNIERLLRHWRRSAGDASPDTQALYMAAYTLTRMAEGGIYDQLGGGFFRYTVDRHWTVPHFEKMLYDNGPLLALCAELWLIGGDALFERATRETADWLLAEMRAGDGTFYATLDADSEGEEGRYYVWTREEARELLDKEQYTAVAKRYGLDREPNFEGRWHLRVRRPMEEVVDAIERDEATTLATLDAARGRLLEARSGRVRPHRDEKILSAWNGLAIRGLAIAAKALDEDSYADAAAAALAALERRHWRDGRLYTASIGDAPARFPAYLDDYACVLDAALAVLEVRWSAGALEWAVALADGLLASFEDEERGGFYFTAAGGEDLIHRSKTYADEATPSGNGIAARALLRLGYLLGEPRYLEAAERTLRAAWQAISEHPQGHASLITALEEYLEPPETVVLRGPEAAIAGWRRRAARMYAPWRLIFAIPDDAADLPGSLALREASPDGPVAYVCRGSECSLPADTWEGLAALLSVQRED